MADAHGSRLTRGRVAVLTAASLAALAVLLALGTWQVERLAWKTALIERIEQRVGAAPVPIPSPDRWPGLGPEEIEYLPVEVAGRYSPDVEFHVQIALTQPHGRYGGLGYFVLTPLVLEDGHVVIVNRGFVPTAMKDPASRPAPSATETVTVRGLARPAEVRSWIAPADDPVRNVWFVRDPKVMAGAAGIDPDLVAPFTIDAFAGPEGTLPQGGETVVAFTNNHLGYAITWYGLAAALVAVYGTLVFKRRV